MAVRNSLWKLREALKFVEMNTYSMKTILKISLLYILGQLLSIQKRH